MGFLFAMNAVSQFAKGYKYVKNVNGVEQPQLISDALAPAFITATIGAEYHPADFFKGSIFPHSPRATILGHNDGRYSSVDPLKPYGVK